MFKTTTYFGTADKGSVTVRNVHTLQEVYGLAKKTKPGHVFVKGELTNVYEQT